MEHIILGPLLLFALTIVIIVVVAVSRSRREKHRLELQKMILERVGSVKDFAEFLTTEQGERFLGSLAPAHFRPQYRSLWSAQVGIVLLTIGVFLMVALHTDVFGASGATSPPRPLFLGILLVMAAGLGMLISAAVSFVIARRLGMVDRRSHGSKTDDAV